MILSWIAFIVVFLVQKKPSSTPAQKREHASIVGIALQGASYALVSIIHRPYFMSIAAMAKRLEIVLAVVTIILAVSSVWFVSSAVRALGKQWSLSARVVEDHELVTHGPYRVVRNPIYTGMLGMLLVTGLALAHWIGLVIALLVFAVGTLIRVRTEEKLMRETFGAQWVEYARRVPAVLPLLNL